MFYFVITDITQIHVEQFVFWVTFEDRLPVRKVLTVQKLLEVKHSIKAEVYSLCHLTCDSFAISRKQWNPPLYLVKVVIISCDNLIRIRRLALDLFLVSTTFFSEKIPLYRKCWYRISLKLYTNITGSCYVENPISIHGIKKGKRK